MNFKKTALLLVLAVTFLSVTACSKYFNNQSDGEDTFSSITEPAVIDTEDVFEGDESETTAVSSAENTDETNGTADSTENSALTAITDKDNTTETSSESTIQTDVIAVQSETHTAVVTDTEATGNFIIDKSENDLSVPYDISKADSINRPYNYYHMTEEEQYVYDSLYNGFKNFDTTLTFGENSTITADMIFKAYQIMINEQVDIFYTDNTINYIINSDKYVETLTLSYLKSKDEVTRMWADCESASDAIIAKITPDMSEYDIVKLFHDEIIKSCEYDITEQDGRNTYGTLVTKRAYCQGYAKTFVYLCNKVGIKSMLISGDVGEQPHMWNMVNIDGDWYQIDITFDDANLPEYPDFVRYDYFCVTDDVIVRDRTLVQTMDFSYPSATATRANYFVKNNLVASDFEDAENIITKLVVDASESMESAVQFSCTDKNTYNSIYQSLFSGDSDIAHKIIANANNKCKHIVDDTAINYNSNDDTYTIKLFLSYKD